VEPHFVEIRLKAFPISESTSAHLIGGKVVHSPFPTADFLEGALQNVGGPDGCPKLFVKPVIVEAVKEILLYAFHDTLSFKMSFGFPSSVALFLTLRLPEAKMSLASLRQ
jgi:hypothetical protein